MGKAFVSKSVFLSCLLLGQVAIADNYKKVVLGSYAEESLAKESYEKNLEFINSRIEKEKKKYQINVVMRESNNHFIVAVEPFKYLEEAKDVMKELKDRFPTAFINNNKETFLDEQTQKSVKQTTINEIDNPNKEKLSNKNLYTLDQMINEIIHKDPEIIERLYQYNAINEDVNISKSGYYPSVDLVGKVGRKTVKKEDTQKDKFNSSEITLKIVQNLFNGYGTTSAVNRDEAKAKAAFNKYLEVTQDKIYRAVEAYIKVVRYAEILKIAKENVKVHEETLVKIQDRYEKGFSTLSEVERVKGRLALSKSNYVSETNNLYDAKFNFHKSLGEYIDENRLISPILNTQLPDTLEEAALIATQNNPSILVTNYDIQAIKESLEYAKRNDLPSLDIELQASKYNNQSASTDGKRDDLSAMLVLNYNLYKGGAHQAEKQKYISLLNYEYAHKNKLKREVLESLNLSWSAYKMINEQYKYQIEYRDLTAKTKNAYEEEFQLGRRTLIDLLDVQDEVNNIKIKVIHNKYDLLFAKYRILDAMGELNKTFGQEFKREYKKDSLKIYVDQDQDKILDYEDQCDNSESVTNNIYGCSEIKSIKVDEIKFNTELKEETNQVDTTGVEKLWGVK